MSNIDFKKLGDYVKIRTGKLDANASSEDGSYPFFTCSIEPLKISSYSYDCECCLVAGNGDLNVKYYNGKFDAYQRTYIIESLNKEKLDVMYLYFFLSSYIEVLRKQSIGGVIKYIKLGNLTDALIPIPPLGKQKEICRNLIQSQKVLTTNQKLLSKYDILIKSRFIEMFGDTVSNPMGWETKSLESVADIVSGITKGRKTKEKELFEVPYMAVSNVKAGYIDWTNVKTIEATKTEIATYQLKINDVLMAEGGDPDKVGRGALLTTVPKNCIHQNHVFRVRLNQLSPIYFSQYLQHEKSKRYFFSCAKQTTGIASINMTQLKELPVLIPSEKKQNDFAAFVQQIDKSKFEIANSLKRLYNKWMLS